MSKRSRFRPQRPHGWSCKFPLDASLADAIPTEIIERIIDCYINNRSMLKTCSLVSRVWHPRSRYHLMSDIYLPTFTQRDELLEALGDPNSLLRFTPITGLTARKTAIYATSVSEDQQSETYHIEDATMRLIQALPDLKYLHLKLYLHIPSPSLGCPTQVMRVWLENRQDKLTHLTISNLWLRADDIFPHIFTLVNLEHLCLNYYSEPNDIIYGGRSEIVIEKCRLYPYPAKLRSLVLQGRGIDFLLAFVDRKNPSPPIPLVDLQLEEITRDRDLVTIQQLYQSPNAHFRTLNVFGRDPIIANLSNQQSLRHVIITYRPTLNDHPLVVGCLNSIKSPFIERITMIFMIGTELNIKSVDWADLRVNLEADNLKNIQVLHCVVLSHMKRTKQAIKRTFVGSSLEERLEFMSLEAYRREVLHGRRLPK